jgi:hypothetical protein
MSSRHRAVMPATAVGVVGCLFLLGGARAFAAPLAGSHVHSGIGTAITTGPTSRAVHTITSAPTPKAPVPTGDRIGSRLVR